jgi:aryl-alcohol dehydrogenase-like predicted oxidoreductase
MKYGSVAGVGDRISRLVMGSMVFSARPVDEVHALYDRFVAAGGNAFDTARVYGRGETERQFGEWVRDRGLRDRITVVGKGAHHDVETSERRVTPTAIGQDVETSLQALGMASIDLYFLHRDDPELPVGPIVEALDEQVRLGRLRAYGGSNWTHERIAEANAYAAAHGRRPFAASSPNLALPVPKEPMWLNCVSLSGDQAAQDWYRQTGLPIFAWSSQARGFFSGRFRPESPEVDPNVTRVYYAEENWERQRRAGELAREKGATPTQVALAWVLHQPLEVFALVGPLSMGELEDCLGALEVSLTPEEADWLNLERERVLPAR